MGVTLRLEDTRGGMVMIVSLAGGDEFGESEIEISGLSVESDDSCGVRIESDDSCDSCGMVSKGVNEKSSSKMQAGDGRDILRKSECVKLLTDKRKYLIEEQDDNGWTVFHYVACNDLYTIVENLVSEDCKSAAYVRDKKYKRTALHVAAYKGNVRVMEKLVQYFPDCWDMVDKNCQNIMHIAVEQDRKEVIRYILSQGCKAYGNLLMQRDKDGNTPLHLITKLGCYVQELMDERTIDWEVLNGENGTPLDHLIHRGKETAPLTDQVCM
ncbi:hypothetical protein ACET3Z_032954 [Daucus carota]